eukprot:TRINITY_DN50918_c0_g1_i1.p1 TRINITY_DN50918_c0_g1~~TRINITY_DN50918_c0_g1_i1.p1  ORF type:complete len:189 (+),score=4.40 TRINITY_DN50918_c0_g1_i1:58-567(+)
MLRSCFCLRPRSGRYSKTACTEIRSHETNALPKETSLHGLCLIDLEFEFWKCLGNSARAETSERDVCRQTVFMLQRGADPWERNSEGRMPVDLAILTEKFHLAAVIAAWQTRYTKNVLQAMYASCKGYVTPDLLGLDLAVFHNIFSFLEEPTCKYSSCLAGECAWGCVP